MTNKYTLYVGRPVSHLSKTATGPYKWVARKIATIVDANTVTMVGIAGNKTRGRAADNWRPY